MPAPVDIWNIALSNIGARSDIQDPAEQSNEAFHCRLHYAQTRDEVLERHDWGFARARSTLSLIATDTTVLLPYSYGLPSDFLALRALNDTYVYPWMPREQLPRYEIGGELDGSDERRVFRSDQSAASLVYTRRVESPAMFPPSFVTVLGWALAARLAMPVARKPELVKEMAVQARDALSEAKAIDANQQGGQAVHTPDWIHARGNDAWGADWPYESIHGYLARP